MAKMDVLLTPGFAHVSSYIFNLLDTPSLCKCKLTCKEWKNFIETQKFYWQRVNHTIINKMMEESFEYVGYVGSKEWLQLLRKLEQSSLYEDTQMLGEILIEFHAVGKSISRDWNPLTICVKLGQFEQVKFLLEHLEDKNPVIDRSKQTVVHLAVAFGHLEIVELLTKFSRVDIKDDNGNTPMHVAALKNQVEISAYLKTNYQTTNITNDSGFTPLHYAAESGHTEVVKILYESQCNPRNVWGNTPLHYAASEGHLEVVSFFLEHLENIHPTNHLGDTPLHNAARDGHFEVVECFLKKSKANPSNSYGITPLHKACIKGHFDIAKLIYNAMGKKLSDNFWNNQISYTEDYKKELENKLNS